MHCLSVHVYISLNCVGEFNTYVVYLRLPGIYGSSIHRIEQVCLHLPACSRKFDTASVYISQNVMGVQH